MFTEQLAIQALFLVYHMHCLLTLTDKFNLFRIADNYAIEQLILHNHLTEADLAVIAETGKMTMIALSAMCP